MNSAAEFRRPVPPLGEAILNALPNPVLLVAPDGKIVDANIAAESFFEISTQFLKRQSLQELVPLLRSALAGESAPPGPSGRLTGTDQIQRLVEIDQSPLGRTGRSNPATRPPPPT